MKRQKKTESVLEKATYFGGKGGIEFILIPEKRKFPAPEPLVPVDYDGYYQGDVLIVTAPLSPEIVGMTAHLISFRRLPFCAPYHVYHCPGDISLDVQGVAAGGYHRGNTMRLIKGGALCRVSRYKDSWSRADLQYALAECKFSCPGAMEPIARRRLAALHYPLPLERVLRFEWFVQHTLIGRGPLLAQLFEPFLAHRWEDEKGRQRFAALRFDQAQDMLRMYREEPWELAWKTVMDNRFGKVKHISFQHYQEAVQGKVVPDDVRYSLMLLWKMRERQCCHNDTLFGLDQMGSLMNGVPLVQQAALEDRIYQYCQSRDLVCFREERLFAFRDDYQDASSIIRSLREVKASAAAAPIFSLRGDKGVPTKPPRLTNDQFRIATHITQHWMSIVLGSPGTGKTAIITWLLSHYKRALAVGFVGMLVKMLQRRNGRRRELAYTIDHLRCCCELNGEPAYQWLAQFEVLVIDECSNVSMGRLTKVLTLFSGLRKVIFVGDTDQLKSMNPGDALYDLVRAFPVHTFRLTENLRVSPELKTLQDIPGHVLRNQLAFIQWAPRAWEAPVSNPEVSMTPTAMIKALYAKLLAMDPASATRLLDVQFLALAHDGPYGRIAVNNAVQEALEQLGILKPSQVFTLYKDFSIYQGCKITFKKNYNHRVEQEFGSFTICSDPVANGELAVIQSIERVKKPGHGILMKISDSSDATPDSFKSVWIDEQDGVKPFDIQLGNAITVYTSQGREFPNVVLCIDPRAGPQWTKANAYVAASRAQKRFVLLGSRQSFNAIASRPNVERRTIFSYLLEKEHELRKKVVAPAKATELIIRDPETLTLLDPNILAVPMFRE